ncbi:MAG: type I-B CRISPR-associated protein Cas7/Csh2 [Anaeromicrobium sp.]|jgi:CRISPR-associated protein Csh2|uniref:type I-B CRISPR-associated protein Cas7/Csh2 n=1 Tax=Anaeromicrobium sp. TaxID=1929132 RepID=UPI0025D08FA0|nr:type I-B CRISPR-associated protein Cas7/Csh2 [Anaeromicrobium sp.]MCT4594743.1 type I-B CRISPR-associated protein Cas7/Csh2 [Anaeromicrobium sp.]
MANSREFLLVWDSTMCIPNGDMLNENRPRQDELTGQLEVSDVRIKRYVRDHWINIGKEVLVQSVEDKKGNIMTCASRISHIKKENKLDDKNVGEYLLSNYIDVRLFGAVITKPKKDIMGPLQIAWSKSVHEAEVKFMQGNAAYAGKEGASQSSIWSKYITPYGLFKTYGVYNDLVAKRQGIEVTEEDMADFVEGLIEGMKNYRSTSKNQMPRLLVEVVYKNNKLDGELDYVHINKDLNDTELRSIDHVSIDLEKLSNYYEKKQEHIKEVIVYKHPSIEPLNVHGDFKVEII